MQRIRLALVLALGSLSSTAVFAQAPAPQDAPPPPMHRAHNPHKQVMRISKELNLSSDQTAKLEPIFAQRNDQMNAIQQNTALTPEQKMTQARELNRNFRQQISGVLTADQMQQWKSMRKEHHNMQQQGAAPTGA